MTARAASHAPLCTLSAACSRTLTSSVGLDSAAATPPLSVPASSLVPAAAGAALPEGPAGAGAAASRCRPCSQSRVGE
jgi:hypothetical protein